MGAVPLKLAKWCWSGNRAMSPVWPMIFAATIGGDAGDLGQRGAGLGDQRAELVGQGLDPGLEGSQADDQVAGELLAGGLGGGRGPDTAQQIGGLAGGQYRSWRRRGSGRAAAGGAG